MTSPVHTASSLVSFIAGPAGAWRIDSMTGIVGPTLDRAERLNMVQGDSAGAETGAAWVLRGAISNTRYTTRDEVATLSAVQEGLGRPAARRAALIPIRKSTAWWALAQDERRAILEEQSHHIAIGLKYLPAIARRLHHGRDLGEPFDFLTWFEYAPEQADAFETLVAELRRTPEWGYVEHEVDIRLSR